MSQSLAKIVVHTIFSTKNRAPFLRNRALREEVHRYLGGILLQLQCPPVLIGGVEDHVHVLAQLSRTCAAAEMVKELKRASSLWLKTRGSEFSDFAWQGDYGIFSVDPLQIESVKKYIADQEDHHRHVSFQDELREFLKRNDVSYDERYVWD